MTDVLYIYDDGWRLAVVVSRGPKHFHAVTVGDLRHIQQSRRDERLARPVDQGRVRPRRLAVLMERRAKLYRRVGRRYPKALVKQAAARLRQGA